MAKGDVLATIKFLTTTRRNEITLKNGLVEIEELVENSKVLAWYWIMSKLQIVRVCFMSGVGTLGIV